MSGIQFQETTQSMKRPAEVAEMIRAGRTLLLAGDESLLSQLPAGNWVGGTSANFMTLQGGLTDQSAVFVTDLSEYAGRPKIRSYSQTGLPTLGANYPSNGFTILIVPGLTDIHANFAHYVQDYPGIYNAPLAGWISGVHVSEIGKRQPKVFCGNGTPLTESAAALHIALPDSLIPQLDIINLFRQGNGDVIRFDASGFSTTGDCLIGGRPANLASYIGQQKLDTKLPLVADYHGAMINVSIQNVDRQSGKVDFYAPVFPGISYRFAEPVVDYTTTFDAFLKHTSVDSVAFSCNCILNFLYAELEGKRTGPLVGPMTFGEIAYILLNQTLVYLSILRT